MECLESMSESGAIACDQEKYESKDSERNMKDDVSRFEGGTKIMWPSRPFAGQFIRFDSPPEPPGLFLVANTDRIDRPSHGDVQNKCHQFIGMACDPDAEETHVPLALGARDIATTWDDDPRLADRQGT